MKIDTKSEFVKNMTDDEFEIYMLQEKNLRIEVDVKYLMDEIIGLEKILHHFDSSGPVENVQVRQKLFVLRSRHEHLLDEKFKNEHEIKKLSRMV